MPGRWRQTDACGTLGPLPQHQSQPSRGHDLTQKGYRLEVRTDLYLPARGQPQLCGVSVGRRTRLARTRITRRLSAVHGGWRHRRTHGRSRFQKSGTCPGDEKLARRRSSCCRRSGRLPEGQASAAHINRSANKNSGSSRQERTSAHKPLTGDQTLASTLTLAASSGGSGTKSSLGAATFVIASSMCR